MAAKNFEKLRAKRAETTRPKPAVVGAKGPAAVKLRHRRLTVNYYPQEAAWLERTAEVLQGDPLLRGPKGSLSFVAQEAMKFLAEALRGKNDEEIIAWFKERGGRRFTMEDYKAPILNEKRRAKLKRR